MEGLKAIQLSKVACFRALKLYTLDGIIFVIDEYSFGLLTSDLNLALRRRLAASIYGGALNP